MKPRTALASRIAFIVVLAAGMVMSLSGTALAVTGISGSGSVGVAQYSDTQGRGGGGTSDAPGADQGVSPGPGGRGEVLGNSSSGGEPQKASQVTASQGGGGGTLPFTGFLAVPLLVGGVALLLTGQALRRQSASPVSA